VPESIPAVVQRYIHAQATRDFDALVDLFADDGVVRDEGKTWRGKGQIRAWREGVASAYQYTTELLRVEAGTGSGDLVAHIRLEGNFPGGVADLQFKFTLRGGQISRLTIEP